MGHWQVWVSVSQTVAMGAMTLWIWASNRRAARKSEVDRQLAELTDRLTVAEQRVRLGPQHDDLARVHERLDAMHGELRHVCGEVSMIRRTMDLVNQHLMEHER